jgi:hypothetical protein
VPNDENKGIAMKIDDRVEPLVRTALDAAVKRNFDKLTTALSAFPDDDTVKKAVELTLAVTGFIMYDVHRGKPSSEQIRAVATKLAEMETWAEPTADEVDTFLGKLVNSQPFAAEVPPENVIILSFVVAANLLSSFRKPEERWWDYLDRVEAAIDAAPSS